MQAKKIGRKERARRIFDMGERQGRKGMSKNRQGRVTDQLVNK